MTSPLLERARKDNQKVGINSLLTKLIGWLVALATILILSYII